MNKSDSIDPEKNTESYIKNWNLVAGEHVSLAIIQNLAMIIQTQE